MPIDFLNKCEILSELWMNYRHDENFEDFVEYNDMGLPLAYFVHTEMVQPTDEAKGYIEETYNLFIAAIGIDLDNEYTTLNELFKAAGEPEE